MKKLRSIFTEQIREESGQAIVIVAAALIVLIGFTGLAIDLGFVWMRQAQLKSIVDSAALAGAPQLAPTAARGGLGEADEKAIQYLATNQILDTNEFVELEELTSFESEQSLSPLGAREYTITVTWDIDLFFMPVFGFDQWTMTESSTAAYFPLVDLYSGRRVALNGVTTSTQAVFGPRQQTSFGDAFSNPTSPFIDQKGLRNQDGEFSFVYRIEVPEGYVGNVLDGATGSFEETNIVRVELLDPDGTNQLVPPGEVLAHSDKFIRELQNAGVAAGDLLQPVDENDCYKDENEQHQPCIMLTCEWSVHANTNRCLDQPYLGYYLNETNPYEIDQINPFWFYRLDELRQPGGTSTDPVHDTVTLYTLYYFQQMPDGSIVKQFLSSYAGQSGHAPNLTKYGVPPIGQYHVSTDLNWVSPGAWNEIGNVPTRCSTQDWARNNGGFDVVGGAADGCTVTNVGDEDALPAPTSVQDENTMGRGFEIDMDEDVPGILVDQVSRMKYIYLEIKTVEGAGENGFEIWAGPPHAHYGGFPSNVNRRNLVMSGSTAPNFGTDGVNVYSVGIMPLNSIAENRVDFPLVYVSPEYAGRDVEISLFDPDSGTQIPICFYFDTIPHPPCEQGFDQNVNGYLKYYGNTGLLTDNLEGRCFPQCQDQFVEPPFVVKVPDFTADCDPNGPFEERMEDCNAFLGGRLMVSYEGGHADTYQWLVNFPSVPYIKN